jgi:hypothetical protein
MGEAESGRAQELARSADVTFLMALHESAPKLATRSGVSALSPVMMDKPS